MRELSTLSEEELHALAAGVRSELQRRAMDAGDLVAITEAAFATSATSRGSLSPEIVSGLLVCRGRLLTRGTGHTCSFAAIDLDGDQSWCWESDYAVHDEVRRNTSGLDTITVLPLIEGMTITQVESRMRGGAHGRTASTSWQVRGSEIVPVAGRAVSAGSAHASRRAV